ncbi:MAG: hypothetical protein M1819_003481 [Sarea resinae]|nr:MAG: hypothetical protein M1819_003481 [Sarea resinae]
MLQDVRLLFQPSAIDALSWSKDGELAIGAGEQVQVLIPDVCLNKPDEAPFQSSPEEQWNSVRFRTNVFSEEDVLIQEAAPFNSFSIGEEESTCTVVSLGWSNPGLGVHCRSVLAVLTTNLVLSIWESSGSREDGASWRRTLVVNSQLEKLLGSLKNDGISPKGTARQMRRIRAFSWSPPCYLPGRDGGYTASGRWGVPFLAVTNDVNDIFILQLRSPNDLTNPLPGWKVELLAHTRASDRSNQTDRFYLSTANHVSHVSWSPWTISSDGDKAEVLLSYISGKTLRFQKLQVLAERRTSQMQLSFVGKELPLGDLNFESGFMGPLRWGGQMINDRFVLTVCARGRIILLFIPPDLSWPDSGDAQDLLRSPDVQVSELEILQEYHDLATGKTFTQPIWDAISGMAIQHDDVEKAFYLHLVSHLSHIETVKCGVGEDDFSSKPFVTRFPTSPWRKKFLQYREQYSNDYDLGGVVQTKSWGAALSPGGTCVAACFSLHPADMIQYNVPSGERSVVVFGLRDQNVGKQFAIVRQKADALNAIEYTTEAFLLDVLYCLPSDQSNNTNPEAINDLLERFEDNLKAVANTPPQDPNTPEFFKMFSRLATEYNVDLTPEIERCHQQQQRHQPAGDNGTSLAETLDMDMTPAMIIPVRGNADLTSSSQSDGVEIRHMFEQCDICGEGMGWSQIQDNPLPQQLQFEAKCKDGHIFEAQVRCALTSLAIQAPGISKYCAVCRREYLDYNRYVGLLGERDHGEPGSAKDHETHDNEDCDLARVLFAACDRCLFCGGGFTE